MRAPLVQQLAFGTPVGTWIAGGWKVTRTRHEPHLRLRTHRHSHANLVCVLNGGFVETIGGTPHDCGSRSVLVKPAGEAHSNVYSGSGAECVIIEPVAGTAGLLGGVYTVFDSVRHLREPAVSLLAAEIAAEAGAIDEAAPLVIESLVIELIARAARTVARERHATPLVARIRELLHAGFRENLTLGEIAREVGRHPGHIVRVFREAERCTIGAYVRRLRVEWAAGKLLAGDESIAEIAIAAGFCDHSHFCRLFRARFGVSPGQFRRGAASLARR